MGNVSVGNRNYLLAAVAFLVQQRRWLSRRFRMAIFTINENNNIFLLLA